MRLVNGQFAASLAAEALEGVKELVAMVFLETSVAKATGVNKKHAIVM